MSEDHRATNWSLVPTQLWRLLDWPDLDSYDLTSLRGVGGGSACGLPSCCAGWRSGCPGARPGLGLGYGMTETNGLGTSLGSPQTYEHPD